MGAGRGRANAMLAACGGGPHNPTVPKPDIRNLQAGEPGVWLFAFQWLWPVACTAANRRLATFAPGEVEDVAVGAIREAAGQVQAGKVESFDDLKALTGVIAARRALDLVRRMQAARRSSGMTETTEGREELASAEPGPLERVDANELARLLTALAAKLPDRQRQLLQAYYVEGLKQSELATVFGMPMGTVGVTLSRALESMREELRKNPQLMKELQEAIR
jgi:RNA polymerase sigma factor (sigma-70 family)